MEDELDLELDNEEEVPTEPELPTDLVSQVERHASLDPFKYVAETIGISSYTKTIEASDYLQRLGLDPPKKNIAWNDLLSRTEIPGTNSQLTKEITTLTSLTQEKTLLSLLESLELKKMNPDIIAFNIIEYLPPKAIL